MPQNTRRYFEELGQSLEGRSPDSPEFAALLRSKIGKEYQHLVNPETVGLAALVGDPKAEPSNLYGVNMGNTTKSLPKRIKEKLETDKQLGKYFQEVGSDRPPQTWLDTITGKPQKRIFALGTQADPETWAHEFRHEEIKHEHENRIQDLLNSTSYPDYKNKINMWYHHITGSPDKKKMPFDQQEKFVLDRLRQDLPLAVQAYMNKQTGKSVNYEDADSFVKNNINMNRSGVKGAHDAAGNKLDDFTIKARADIPLLNFIGMGKTSELTPAKKAAGGSVENTTHDRKII